jgi:multidrug resistance efflux pump
MKQFIVAFTIVFGVGSCLVYFERYGDNDLRPTTLESQQSLDSWNWSASETDSNPLPNGLSEGPRVRAPGRIEGRTETIEIRSRLAEQIVTIHVAKGQWVSAGEVLISLDSAQLTHQRDLAKAQLEMSIAKKDRLINGARESEIEAAAQDAEAQLAPLWSAKRALQRGIRLFEGNAVSEQALDELQAEVDSRMAIAAAAKARLENVVLPPRADDLLAANAAVRVAESSFRIAQIHLDRSQLTAPVDGRILEINAEVGELTGPNDSLPLMIMVDTNQLHAVAEVDEFDALRVQLGQECEITSDASKGIVATGKIVEIEPQMHRKKIYGQHAGERNDTFGRQVRILLEGSVELPIGLPIEVAIRATSGL